MNRRSTGQCEAGLTLLDGKKSKCSDSRIHFDTVRTVAVLDDRRKKQQSELLKSVQHKLDIAGPLLKCEFCAEKTSVYRKAFIFKFGWRAQFA